MPLPLPSKDERERLLATAADLAASTGVSLDDATRSLVTLSTAFAPPARAGRPYMGLSARQWALVSLALLTLLVLTAIAAIR